MSVKSKNEENALKESKANDRDVIDIEKVVPLPLDKEINLHDYIPESFNAEDVFKIQTEAENGSLGHFINNLSDFTNT